MGDKQSINFEVEVNAWFYAPDTILHGKRESGGALQLYRRHDCVSEFLNIVRY